MKIQGSMISLVLFGFLSFSSTQVLAEIDSQIVKMNLQIKSKKDTHKSDLTMPFYQVAEYQNKDYVIELNPRKGKNADEVLLSYKVIKAKNGRSVKSGEAVLTSNKPLNIKAPGVSLKVASVL